MSLVLGSMRRKIATVAALLLFALSMNALAEAPRPRRRTPPPPPQGGSGPCYQCLKGCYDTYQKNVQECNKSVTCLDLALAEHDACVGFCYSDVC
jgi:hypothetical protein